MSRRCSAVVDVHVIAWPLGGKKGHKRVFKSFQKFYQPHLHQDKAKWTHRGCLWLLPSPMSWSSSPTPFSDAWSQVSDKWQRPSSRSSTPPGLPPPSARTLARASRSLLPRCPDPPGQPHPFRSMGVNLSLPRSSPPGLWPPLARAPQQVCLPLRHHQERHLYTVIVVSEGNCNSYRDQTYCLLLLLLLQSQDNDSPWHHRHCYHQGLLKLHSHCWLCHRRRQVLR